MTVDKNKEEEYQFPDQEEYNIGGSADGPSASTTDVDQDSVVSSNQDGLLNRISQHPLMHNKRMIAAIALVLVVMIVVFVVRHNQSDSMQNSKTFKQKIVASKSQNTYQKRNDELRSYYTRIENNKNTIQQLSGQIHQMNLTVQALQSQQAQIAAMLHPLQISLIQLNAQMKKINLSKAKKKKIASEAYFIKAMIPGRAWLVSSFGLTQSVGEGEYLKGYGKILSVDINDGIVTTSSGRRIAYGKRDY